jgi:hypothetical protein
MSRALPAAALAALIAGCGGEAPAEAPMRFAIKPSQAIPGVAIYDVRIFGALIGCPEVMADPNAYLSNDGCDTVAEADAATVADLCHIRHVFIEPGKTTQIKEIPAGNRTVFVVGRASVQLPSQTLSKGCGQLSVTAGQAAAIEIPTEQY